MHGKLDALQTAATTWQHILEAATVRFAHYSYEDTRLRDIAADVDVDVAFVHRSFGSKAQLFSEAVNAAARRCRRRARPCLRRWPAAALETVRKG